MEQYLTQSEFAKRMNVTYITVRRWVRDGKVKSVTVAGKVRIPVEELKATERKGG